jgi:hypothetical protein
METTRPQAKLRAGVQGPELSRMRIQCGPKQMLVEFNEDDPALPEFYTHVRFGLFVTVLPSPRGKRGRLCRGRRPIESHPGPVRISFLPYRTWEITPMNSTCQTAQEQQPANLAALQQTLREMFAIRTKPVTEKPVVVHGPVMEIRGK